MNRPRTNPTADPRVVAFWTAFEQATGERSAPADVFSFSDTPEAADELASLVLAGTKRATAGSVVEYDEEGWRPAVGDLSVVLRVDGEPVAIMGTTDVRIGPLTSVTEDFAWEEGEGDRTRPDWIDGHRAYFQRSFARQGRTYHPDPELVFERFELVWPPDVADRP